MLGRVAQNLFWLSRYVERAENMARLLEVGYRMSLTSRREGGASEHLVSMLQAAEADEDFAKKHKLADVASVSQFMLFDETNPSSVRSCLLGARTNARSVRTDEGFVVEQQPLTRDVRQLCFLQNRRPLPPSASTQTAVAPVMRSSSITARRYSSRPEGVLLYPAPRYPPVGLTAS